MRKSLFLWLCFFTTNIAFGQQCRDEVLLNTGYNHTTNSLYALGQADGYWQVTQMPNFTGCTNINVPSTSFLVNSSAWATFPQSAWLSYRPDAALSCNNKCGEAQAVTFERKFCMVESDTVQIYMQLKFDNSACVLG